MRKLNQEGMTGPVEIGLIAVFVVFVGFVAYRIGDARTDDTAANNAADSSEQEASEIALAEAEADQAKEVELPSDEEKKEEVTENKPESEEVIKDTEPTDPKKEEEENKKEYTYVDFVSGSAVQDGSTVVVNAKLEKRVTGTCYMKLYREGEPKVTIEKRLEFQETCDAVFDTADLSVAGEWEFHYWFQGDGGTQKGYGDNIPINITL